MISLQIWKLDLQQFVSNPFIAYLQPLTDIPLYPSKKISGAVWLQRFLSSLLTVALTAMLMRSRQTFYSLTYLKEFQQIHIKNVQIF